jgi:F420-non-reducing hydrogenase small subunit
VSGKLKIAMYWAGSCGGCDISLLEIGPKLLDLIEVAEVVFWPCAADFKYADVARYPDSHIDCCFFNGSVRNSEQEEVARLLRRKSKTLVAYGSCAGDGGIPALANLFTPEEIFRAAYLDNPSTANPAGTLPKTRTVSPVGDLTIPAFYGQVLRLSDVVEVDYILPGCPPQADRVWEAVTALATGAVPQRNAAVRVGCGDKSVCDECPREKRLVKIERFHRPHEIRPEPGWCLLEQGILCMGPATRSGCGALCVNADMPCRGCYGPAGSVSDQGTAMVGAVGSLLAAKTEEEAAVLVAQIADPVGTFFRFSMSSSHLKGRGPTPGEVRS